MKHYEKMIVTVKDHMDEWHTTDPDGYRRCDYWSQCPLNQIQGSTYDWLPPGRKIPDPNNSWKVV